MRIGEIILPALIGSSAAFCAHSAVGQDDRDYVFEDEDGHRVLRFVGVAPGELSWTQQYEISNAEFSQMVHDRIQADLKFEAEPVDADWAETVAPRIREYFHHHGPEFSAATVECRSESCRLVLQQAGRWEIAAHRAVMQRLQLVIEELVESDTQDFDVVFLMTAYYQESETPHLKAYLNRAD